MSAPRSRQHQRPPNRALKLAFIATLTALASLTVLALYLIINELTRPAAPSLTPAARASSNGVANDALRKVVPQPSWLKLEPDRTLSRIAFGSCLDQKRPQPIWQAVIAHQPELFIMLGDNVYAKDVASKDASELLVAYERQAHHPDLAVARAAFPFLATWDDHDYGRNDAGADFKAKELATQIFRAF